MNITDLKIGVKDTIVGKAAIIVVDIFESDFGERTFSVGIPSMGGARERMDKAAEFVIAGRKMGLPVVIIHEVHRCTCLSGDWVGIKKDHRKYLRRGPLIIAYIQHGYSTHAKICREDTTTASQPLCGNI